MSMDFTHDFIRAVNGYLISLFEAVLSPNVVDSKIIGVRDYRVIGNGAR